MAEAVLDQSDLVTRREEETLRPGADLLSAIGNTPLIRLRRLRPELPDGVELYAKAEYLNPGGSVKDRAALSMILSGERSGLLTPDKTILDATSGNTGIAYAMIGALRGYRVTLCIPANASLERKRMLRSFGARLVETDSLQATDGSQIAAKELADSNPGKYFYPDQYNNDANWKAHYEGTAPEIWRQTDGRITHFVAGIGTSGTFVGVTRRLREYHSGIRAVSVQPDSALHGLEGMKHLESSIVPGIYDPSLSDDQLEVATEDAQSMTRQLAREEGLYVGVSSGANIFAAIRVARASPPGSVVVSLLCDTGSRYVTDDFWDENPE